MVARQEISEMQPTREKIPQMRATPFAALLMSWRMNFREEPQYIYLNITISRVMPSKILRPGPDRNSLSMNAKVSSELTSESRIGRRIISRTTSRSCDSKGRSFL